MPMTGTAPWKRNRHLPWLPVPFFLAAIAALFFLDRGVSYERPRLLLVLNVACSGLPSLFVAYLCARSFRLRATPGMLLLGCGVLLWSAAGIVGIASGMAHATLLHSANVAITIHNTCVFGAALCLLGGSLLLLRPGRDVRAPGAWIAGAYSAAVGGVALVTLATFDGAMPVFFVQGRGGTPFRQFVLGISIAAFTVTGALVWTGGRRTVSSFARWFAPALVLIAAGLLAVAVQSVQGGLLGWAGRSAQFMGSLYMLVAAFASVRESGAWEISGQIALREAQQRFENLLDLVADGIVVHERPGSSSRGRFLQANPAMCRMLGYTADEFRALIPGDILAPEATALAPDGVLRHDETLVAKDGRHIPTEITTRLYTQNDRPMAISIIRDVTERRGAEEALREQTQRYELVLAGAHAALWDWDVLHHRVVFSPQWKELRGLAFDDVGDDEQSWSSGIHPDDAPRVKAAVAAHLEGRTPAFMEEYRVRCKDGSWKWILDRGVALRDAQGNVVRMAGSEEDITERKAAEEALRASEAKYRVLFQNMAEGFALYELVDDGQGRALDWRVLEVNDAYTRHTGIARERIVGRRIGEVFPAALPEYLPRFAGVVDSKEPVTFETYAAAVDRYQRVTTFPAGGRRFASIVEDVTARKHAEEALRASEERLRSLASATFEGIAVIEDNRLVDLNDQLAQLLGYGRDELLGKRAVDLLPPGDRSAPADNLGADDGTPSEHSLRRKDGTLVRVEAHAKTVGGDGHRLRFVALRDITERNRAEDALRESRSAALNLMQDSVEARQEAERSSLALIERNAELARFNRTAVDRELRMIELKKEVNELRARAGEPPRYPLEFEKERK